MQTGHSKDIKLPKNLGVDFVYFCNENCWYSVRKVDSTGRHFYEISSRSLELIVMLDVITIWITICIYWISYLYFCFMAWRTYKTQQMQCLNFYGMWTILTLAILAEKPDINPIFSLALSKFCFISAIYHSSFCWSLYWSKMKTLEQSVRSVQS